MSAPIEINDQNRISEIVRPPASPPFWKKQAFPSKHWSESTDAAGRRYYIDHAHRITSWIDPRDHPDHPRRPNDLPYGWDFAEDPDVGIYFIDHLSKRNTLDDPRMTQEYQLRQEHFAKLLQEERANLEERRRLLAVQQEEVRAAEALLQKEIQRKALLEEAIRKGKDMGTDTSDLEADLAQLNARIQLGQRALAAVKDAHSNMGEAVAESEQTYKDLQALEASLSVSAADELEAARKVQTEINDSRAQYEADRAVRVALEDQVRTLSVAGGEALHALLDENSEAHAANGNGLVGATAGSTHTGSATLVNAGSAAEGEQRSETESRTRLELGLELMTMRKMIAEQRKDIDELRQIKALLEAEDGASRLANLAASLEAQAAAKDEEDAQMVSMMANSSDLTAVSTTGPLMASGGLLVAGAAHGGLVGVNSGSKNDLSAADARNRDVGSAQHDGTQHGNHSADYIARKRAEREAAGRNPDESTDDEDDDGVYVSVGDEADEVAVARRKRAQFSEDTLDNEDSRKDFEERMRLIKGRDWRQTLRRVYQKKDVFPSHPESLTFNAKLSYFKKLMEEAKGK
ncbi:hypothetical protein CAOG_03283 [Capsaspora owczarzaki ATCC 30864]|uniref:WW domain-containing protein n=1 Tax=Capsaspora owczarzaki (strain ATCC 30864) TaxID=595528 RepID=A0A0D2VPB1_CAPO3|nr:hypothetical protein CAOG_03283 [Capsaspora owczarzaki ATCC 30864]KJE92282.1 hypothetical protein CAOG_003283 [Capsaspora owczarzaki ATCC 30864]|eukprot:XP_004364122.1 hypothetical protein CAOG_03283 [Capsaspora owczarzaki ATCC 30864]